MSLLLCVSLLSACGNQSTDKTPAESKVSSNTTDNSRPLPSVSETPPPSTNEETIEIQSCYNIHDSGIVETLFTMHNTEYYGLINSKGEIFYYSENSFDLQSIGNNYGYIYESEKYGLINYETGKTTWFEADEFDEVIGYGGGFLLTYKDNSNISVSEHIYCVIDAATGKIVKQYTNPRQIQHPYSDQYDYIYMSDGWFVSKPRQANLKSNTWLYDSNNNISYVVDSYISIIGDSFVNGKLYMKTSMGSVSISRREADGKGKYIDFPSSIEWHFVFDQSGYVEKADPFTTGATGLIVTSKDVEYVQLMDTATKNTYQYTNFSAKMIDLVKAYKDYCLVFIEGADYKDYFTLIDNKGQQLFEPIKYTVNGYDRSYIELSEDRIIYHKSSSDVCQVYDLNGQEVFSIDSDEIFSFHNGITLIEDKIIDKFGNELAVTIKK